MSTENTKKCYLDLAGLSKYDELIKQYIADKDLVITGTLVEGDYKTIKALSDAIKSLEGTNHSHTNKTVLDGITSEKVKAWDQAATDDHTHSNKELLDTYTQTEADLADAVSKKHSHTNKTVLDGITSEKVKAWDAAQANVIESISVNGVDATITDKKATVTIPEATTAASGVMSASDKIKLDGIAAGAEVNYIKSVGDNLSVDDNGKLTVSIPDATVTGVDGSTVDGLKLELKDKKVTLVDDGLSSTLTSKDVTVRKKEGTTDDQCVYEILQGETVVGTINHPKELVVTGGEVITGTGADDLAKDEKYLKLTIANQTDPVYIAVKDLVDAYTKGNGITIGEDNTISLNVASTSDISLSFNKDGQLEAKFVETYEAITDDEIASLFGKEE